MATAPGSEAQEGNETAMRVTAPSISSTGGRRCLGSAAMRETTTRLISNNNHRRATAPRVRSHDGNGARVSSAGGIRRIGQQK